MISPQLTDTELISRVTAGDQALYAGVVERYQNFVFTLVLRYTDNREDAEEIAQDVFIKAYRSLGDFRGDSKFSTWLFTIARTTSISFLRKRKPDTLSLDDEKRPVPAANQTSAYRADQVEQKSRHKMIREAISLLGPDDAQVLTLFYKGEQTLGEIGQVMNLDPNTVKVKLHRARVRLKEKLERFYSEEVKELHDD